MKMELWSERASWLEPPVNGLNLDLWPAHVWDDNELSDLKSVLNKYGPIEGQRSDGARGFELQIIISFAVGAIASGFLNNLGSDVYTKLKTVLLNGLYRKKKKVSNLKEQIINDLDSDELFGCLRIVFPFDDGKVDFECWYRSDKELSNFFKVSSLVNNAYAELLNSSRKYSTKQITPTFSASMENNKLL
ncbi:MAG: hypothetical protein AAGA77_01195 [Bacteroidota bacterium]